MANTPHDLLAHASAILDGGSGDEIVRRAAVNRSYYAVYHTARAIANSLTLPPSDPTIKGSHNQLYDQLIGCEKSHTSAFMAIRQIGYMARGTLKPYRVRADYELGENLSDHMCNDAMAKAKLLLEKAKHFVT